MAPGAGEPAPSAHDRAGNLTTLAVNATLGVSVRCWFRRRSQGRGLEVGSGTGGGSGGGSSCRLCIMPLFACLQANGTRNATLEYEEPDPEEMQHAILAFYLVLVCGVCPPRGGERKEEP